MRTTKIFSNIPTAADKARKTLVLGHKNNHSLFSVYFKRHLNNMVEQSSSSASSSKVQSLFELCKNTLTTSGIPPLSSKSEKRICSLLDTVGPSDVGLKQENPDDDRGHGFFGLNRSSRLARWAQPITYIDIYGCESFTMCIFCFPTSAVIPLHDHPGMTVFSKLLYGSMHVKAYDWVEPAYIQGSVPGCPPARLAKLVDDRVLTAPCGTSVLYPKGGGNLHCFTAVTPCAMLDILTPPYREDAGRKCTYYHDYPYSTSSTGSGADIGDGKEEEFAWLVESGVPDDLYMRQGLYNGPAIHDD